MAVRHPEQFGLGLHIGESDACSERPLRVLELGAGKGSVSLTAVKVLVASSVEMDCRAAVVATDFHPSVLHNLRANIDRNFPRDPSDGTVTITSHFLDWSKLPAMPSVPQLLSEPFDVIFGADIVYEADHAVWIKKCLEWLLRRRPSTSAACPLVATFHLVIPLRPTHLLEAGNIETTFRRMDDIPCEDHPELVMFSKETMLCQAYRDGDAKRECDVIEYLYYRIGWSRQD